MSLPSNVPTIWNADEERMKSAIYFLSLCDVAFSSWDLESIYSSLHSLKRVMVAKLHSDPDYQKLLYKHKDKDGNSVEPLWTKMESVRRILYNESDEYEIEKRRVEFYNVAEKIYEKLTILMKEHGMFFREGRDPRKAALRV